MHLLSILPQTLATFSPNVSLKLCFDFLNLSVSSWRATLSISSQGPMDVVRCQGVVRCQTAATGTEAGAQGGPLGGCKRSVDVGLAQCEMRREPRPAEVSSPSAPPAEGRDRASGSR